MGGGDKKGKIKTIKNDEVSTLIPAQLQQPSVLMDPESKNSSLSQRLLVQHSNPQAGGKKVLYLHSISSVLPEDFLWQPWALGDDQEGFRG